MSERRGFKEEDFANLHPGGKLGKSWREWKPDAQRHALPRVHPSR